MAIAQFTADAADLVEFGPFADAIAELPVETREPVSYVVEVVEGSDVWRLRDAWLDLSIRAVEPNALMASPFALAALTQLADAQRFQLAAIWRTDSSAARLVGLFAFRATSTRWGLPLRLALGMAHNYGPLGTPLIDAEHGEKAVEALLQWLRHRPVGARVAVIPFLPTDGPVAALLRHASARLGLRTRLIDPFLRGMAVGGGGTGRYTDAALGKKKRHDIARQRRRLEEHGKVTAHVLTKPSEVARALGAFLRLEVEGWKGRAGTATSQRADRLEFMRRAVRGMAEAGQARIHLLALDNRAIAVGIGFLEGDRAWFWKIAYDEAYARYSPGVQVAIALTDDFLAVPGVRSIDSVAGPGHPMIDHLFRERLAVADWLIDLTPGGSIAGDIALVLEGLRRSVRRTAIALVRRRAT